VAAVASPPRRGARTRRRRIALLALLALVAAGCSAHATLEVRMNADGSGAVAVRVALDAEAVQTAQAGGAPLEQTVRLADLRAAGWKVSAWARARDGSASITITKPFRRPDQVAAIGRELSGAAGPLRGFGAARRTAWLGLAHTSSVRGVLDLRGTSSGVPGDAALLATLTGHGIDVRGLDQELTAQIRSGFALRVVTRLPGGTHTASVAPGTRVPLSVSSTDLDSRRAGLVAGGVALLLLAGLTWRHGRARARVRRLRAAPPPGRRAPR
jgi:hypothetical protein